METRPRDGAKTVSRNPGGRRRALLQARLRGHIAAGRRGRGRDQGGQPVQPHGVQGRAASRHHGGRHGPVSRRWWSRPWTSAGPDPVARSRRRLGAHIRFHAQHARETFIGNSELRALMPDQRQADLQATPRLRGADAGLIVDCGRVVGECRSWTPDSRPTPCSRSGMHVASWYRDDAAMSR